MKVGVLICAAVLLQAESARELCVANAWLNNGLHVKVTAIAGSAVEAGYGFGIATTSRNSIYREFMDKKRVVFGYEIEVNRLQERDRVEVVIKPLGSEYTKATGNQSVPTFASARVLPVMWFGDKATIDVLENPSTGHKIADTIQVDAEPQSAVPDTARTGIGFFSPRVTIDGKPAGGAGGSGVRGDEIVMFYIPGRGSYFSRGSRLVATISPRSAS